MNKNILEYTGKLNIRYLINNKEVQYKGHNEGLSALFKYICKVLSGNLENAKESGPTFVDVRFLAENDGTIVQTSCLYNKIDISNKEYFFDTSISSWVARFKTVLSYNMINFSIVNTHLQDTVYLYLVSGNGQDLARLLLTDALDLRDITVGTQALVEWTMQVQNSMGD